MNAHFVYLQNIVIVSLRLRNDVGSRTFFLRLKGRIALSPLQKVHAIYRNVVPGNLAPGPATHALKRLMQAPPIYSPRTRCFLAFLSASILCGLSFGGSLLDMWVSGACACVLQYLGLDAANKSAMYANVSIIVAFIARGFLLLQRNLLRWSRGYSAWVHCSHRRIGAYVGLCRKNIFRGSVRMVYAVITLFLGFGLTIGSDFYLLVDPEARRRYYYNHQMEDPQNLTYIHGTHAD